MAYDPVTIANRFIELARQRGEALTPMQLNKLTYVAHGFSLGLAKRPLIDGEVQAWKYGPVIPSLYQQLKHYGAEPVHQNIPRSFWKPAEELAPWDRSLVDSVFAKYGNLTGSQLSFITHKKGTPWERTFEPNVMGKAIGPDLIGQHYADILNGVA